MKITKSTLKKLIKEELEIVLNEQSRPDYAEIAKRKMRNMVDDAKEVYGTEWKKMMDDPGSPPWRGTIDTDPRSGETLNRRWVPFDDDKDEWYPSFPQRVGYEVDKWAKDRVADYKKAHKKKSRRRGVRGPKFLRKYQYLKDSIGSGAGSKEDFDSFYSELKSAGIPMPRHKRDYVFGRDHAMALRKLNKMKSKIKSKIK